MNTEDLVIGEVYWCRRVDSPNCFWRKFFGNGKWGINYEDKESAILDDKVWPPNNNKITLTEPPKKKERRCLNPVT